MKDACAAHRALGGNPECLAAECAPLAIQPGADVWIERVEADAALARTRVRPLAFRGQR